MSDRDLLLSIDNGTQSLKALVFDLDGQLIKQVEVQEILTQAHGTLHG